MATRRVRKFLDGSHQRYVTISHSPAYTASQVAESAHIRGRYMAKVVVVVVDARLALAVVPSTKQVDMSLLKTAAGARDVRLADEAEFAHRFEGCRPGAAPPFGVLFGMDAYVDPAVLGQEQIAFNAGTHTDVIVMDTDDYFVLARPIVAAIACEPIESPLYVCSI